MMWIYAVVIFLVTESRSQQPGLNIYTFYYGLIVDAF